MNEPTKAAAAGEKAASNQSASAKESGLILTVEVLENGMIHAGYHHAAGKIMDIPKDAAEYLAAAGKVKILGTA